ncbi:MAG: hypothetical protein ABIK28_22980, partial [Planctomycetota bacterium]
VQNTALSRNIRFVGVLFFGSFVSKRFQDFQDFAPRGERFLRFSLIAVHGLDEFQCFPFCLFFFTPGVNRVLLRPFFYLPASFWVLSLYWCFGGHDCLSFPVIDAIPEGTRPTHRKASHAAMRVNP